MVTVASNCEKIKGDPERVSNIKLLISKCEWKGINYLSKNMFGKCFRKIIQQLLLIFSILKIKKYFRLIIKILIRVMKNI